jgi:hypothetical protein
VIPACNKHGIDFKGRWVDRGSQFSSEPAALIP